MQPPIPASGSTDLPLAVIIGGRVAPTPLARTSAASDALGSAPTLRPAGSLADLGAPSLYYINMDGDALSAEKSQFHGIGIAPDADVPLTADDFRDGRDPELEAAIAWLSAPRTATP